MWVAARRRVVVRGGRIGGVRRLVSVLRLLELNALLVLAAIVTVILIELLPGMVRLLRIRGSLSAVLRRRGVVGRGRSHPACSSQRLESLATATARITCKKQKERNGKENHNAGKNPSPPPIPA